MNCTFSMATAMDAASVGGDQENRVTLRDPIRESEGLSFEKFGNTVSFSFVVVTTNHARIKSFMDTLNVFYQESNNTIPSTELGTVVRSLGLVPTEGELQDILSEVRRKSSWENERFSPRPSRSDVRRFQSGIHSSRTLSQRDERRFERSTVLRRTRK